MKHCGIAKLTLAFMTLVALIAAGSAASQAAPMSLTLARTAQLIGVDDAAGSTLWESGTVSSGNTVIAHFVRTIRVVTGVTEAQNTGIVTLTILGLGPAPPVNLTLLGSHDFNSGNDIGGISAASVPGLTGFTWSLTVVSSGLYTLTLNLP